MVIVTLESSPTSTGNPKRRSRLLRQKQVVGSSWSAESPASPTSPSIKVVDVDKIHVAVNNNEVNEIDTSSNEGISREDEGSLQAVAAQVLGGPRPKSLDSESLRNCGRVRWARFRSEADTPSPRSPRKVKFSNGESFAMERSHHGTYI